MLAVFVRIRAASSVAGRLVPLAASSAAGQIIDVDRGERQRQKRREWYEQNKDRLAAVRQQRRLVAGLAGLAPSALPKRKATRYTLPQLLRALDDNRAVAVRIFDVRQVSTLCNYLVVASAASMRHLQAITTNVAKEARSRIDQPLQGSSRLCVEGEADEEWTCLDMGDIVLHLMSDSVRTQYDIESRYRQYQVHGDPVPEPAMQAPDDDDDDVEYRVLR